MATLEDFNISNYYDKARAGRLIYSFIGPISVDSLNSIINNIEEVLEEKVQKRISRKRIFNIIVELVQNQFKFTSVLPQEFKETFILIQQEEDGFEIISGNYLESKAIKPLSSRVNMINYLSISQLNEMYSKVLSSGMITEQHGAGLGIIDIARRSNNELTCTFDVVNDNFSFFIIKAVITDS